MALLLPLLHQKTHPEILIVGGLRISFLVFGGSFHVMLVTNVKKIYVALLPPLLHQKTHPEILFVGGLKISFLVFGGSFHVMLLTNVEKIHVQIRENKNNHIASNSYREVQQ